MVAQPKLVLRGRSGLALHHMAGMRFTINCDRVLAGVCGFTQQGAERLLVIDYEVWADYQRRGLATQSVEQLCNWAFQELAPKRILAVVNIQNLASQKVLGRNGFAVCKASTKLYYCDKYRPKDPA